jgi:hypothetical protein
LRGVRGQPAAGDRSTGCRGGDRSRGDGWRRRHRNGGHGRHRRHRHRWHLNDGHGRRHPGTGGTNPGTAGSIGPIGGGAFLPATEYATGFNTNGVAIGDLDADGTPDIAVVSYGHNDSNDGSVSVLLNRGGGLFQAAVDYPVFGMPRAIALGDVTGDGRADLIVPDPSRGAITLFRNDGRAGFSASMNFATGRFPSDVALGDFNGDGRPDIATANEEGTVSVLLAAVGPGIGPHVDYPAGLGTRRIAVADLNGDRRADIAVGNAGTPSEAGNVSVLINRGDGTFAAPVAYPLTGQDTFANGVAAGDLDGDGHRDLAVLTYTGQGVTIFRNQGNGTFALSTIAPAGARPIALAIGDLDGNGSSDLAFADYAMTGNGAASVLLFAGTGQFAGPYTYGAGVTPMGVALGDLNGDGRLDIAIANQGATVSVLLSAPR